jgi:AcrR family transcriptional regulator
MNEKTAPKSPRRLGRPPKDEASDTRGLILEVALGLFAREGFAGASIRKIAREVGITESAIYAHFEGKRAIYDALFAEAGPHVVLDALASEQELAGDSPEEVLRRLVRRVLEDWDEPRARLFASFFVREGGLEGALGSEGEGTSLVGAIEEMQRQLGKVFRRWMDAGLVREDSSPEHLAWELFAPVAYVRLLYLHGQATQEERRAGRRLAEKHVDYFLSCVLRDPKKQKPKNKRR